MNEELKPCPFCGGEAIIQWIEPHTHTIAIFMPDYEGGAFIECTKCTAAMSGVTVQEAISSWNHRTEPEPKPLVLKELREMEANPIYVISFDREKPRWYQLSRNKQFVKDFNQCKRLLCNYGITWLAYDRPPKGE